MVKEIYLDYAATTPMDKSVAKEISKTNETIYSNPSSPHAKGKEARASLEMAREKIAAYLGARTGEIIFTSGGTESNNCALRGLTKAHPLKKHIIVSSIEHPSILEVCKELEKEGYKVTYLGVNAQGIISLEELKKSIRPDTLVVSVMYVNNETGVIQPIKEISKICKEKNVFFHSDMVQALGKIPLNLHELSIDVASFSAHKVHGPKGVGVLYVRDGVNIKPLLYGGGQEKGLRSGTENVSGALGLAKALEIKVTWEKVKEVKNELIRGIEKIPSTLINSPLDKSVPGILNMSFKGIEGNALLDYLSEQGIYASAGSACSSKKLEESHVLHAIGVPPLYIHGSIRLSFETLTKNEISYVLKKIEEGVSHLRALSPFT